MIKKNKIRIRYLFLIALAILPFYKFYHEGDYCFGDADLVVIGGYTLLFIITFLVIIFNNLYIFTLKKELFNFRPVIIAILFFTGLFLCFTYHTENYFKEKMYQFKSISEFKDVKISLYDDATFQIDKTFSNYKCYYKGTYTFKNDTLRLVANNNELKDSDLKYVYNAQSKLLTSIMENDLVLKELGK